MPLGGGAVNPATGDVDSILRVAKDKRRLGAQEHPKISRQFRGAYDLKRLTDYLTGVGRKLAANAEYPAERSRPCWTRRLLTLSPYPESISM